MKVAQNTGKLFGKVVAGTKSAPGKSARRLTAIKNDLHTGFVTGMGTTKE